MRDIQGPQFHTLQGPSLAPPILPLRVNPRGWPCREDGWNPSQVEPEAHAGSDSAAVLALGHTAEDDPRDAPGHGVSSFRRSWPGKDTNTQQSLSLDLPTPTPTAPPPGIPTPVSFSELKH